MTVSDTDAGEPLQTPDLSNALSCLDDERQRLLRNPDFRLVKVVRNHRVALDMWRFEIESLTVVTPASDPEIAREVERDGWLCLSHMWGDPASWVDWDDACVVDGGTGDRVDVKIHPDKRETIMSLLQSKGEYWWIDIFCARHDTPLVIMGDIYRHSAECVALMDSTNEIFYSKQHHLFAMACAESNLNLVVAADRYVDTLRSKGDTLVMEPGWKTVLNDVLQWSMDHFDENTATRLRRMQEVISNNPTLTIMYHIVSNPSTLSRLEESLASHQLKIYDNYHIMLLAETMKEWKASDLNRSLQVTADFLECQWMNRAWTLQELALPWMVEVTRPYLTPGADSDQLDVNIYSLQGALACSLKVVAKAYDIQMEANGYSDGHSLLEGAQTPRNILDAYQCLDPVLSRIYSDYRKLLEVVTAIGLQYRSEDEVKVINRDRMRKLYLNTFATSQRKACYPVDYVYSVLGILDIDIPRLDDSEEIWRRFAKAIQDKHPDIDVPCDVDLASATKMEDVYGNFKFTIEDTILSDADMDCFRNNS